MGLQIITLQTDLHLKTLDFLMVNCDCRFLFQFSSVYLTLGWVFLGPNQVVTRGCKTEETWSLASVSKVCISLLKFTLGLQMIKQTGTKLWILRTWNINLYHLHENNNSQLLSLTICHLPWPGTSRDIVVPKMLWMCWLEITQTKTEFWYI